jgi:hypothetical protein
MARSYERMNVHELFWIKLNINERSWKKLTVNKRPGERLLLCTFGDVQKSKLWMSEIVNKNFFGKQNTPQYILYLLTFFV